MIHLPNNNKINESNNLVLNHQSIYARFGDWLKQFAYQLFKTKPTMARPIKETPILYGNDAKNFEKANKAVHDRRLSKEELKKAKEDFEQISKLMK